jgi:hypothetical protein
MGTAMGVMEGMGTAMGVEGEVVLTPMGGVVRTAIAMAQVERTRVVGRSFP